MIAPAKRRPAKRRPTAAPGYAVEFRIDQTAEPGDVLPSLARLLIDLARRRRAAESSQDDVDQQAGDGDGGTNHAD